MTALAWLIPIALLLALLGLIAFMWALRSGQFEDLEGAAYRILEDDREEPAPPAKEGDAANADQAKPAPQDGEAEDKKG
jgi:cbb3-type cytochrome oxidase maturation protein